MNARERTLAVVLLVLIVGIGGGFFGYVLYLSPLRDRDNRLNTLRADVEKKEGEIRQIQRDLPKLERWQQLSLPTDQELARREYERYLIDILRESGYAPGSYTVTPPKTVDVRMTAAAARKAAYTPLAFKVKMPTNLTQLVGFLSRFYGTTAMHQIKTMTVKRNTTSTQNGLLDVDLTIEALVLTGPQSKVRPVAYAVAGAAVWAARPANRLGTVALADPPRDYTLVAAHNMFLGPPQAPPSDTVVDRTETTRLTYLDSITVGPDLSEASLRYRHNNRSMTIRAESTFPILEDSRGRPLVEGVVMRLEERDLIFRVRLVTASGNSFRRSPDPERWSRPDKKTMDELAQSKAVTAEETERVFQIGRDYWERLDREGIVNVRGQDFAFRWDLVCGKVLRTDDRLVIVKVNEKYCAYGSLARAGGGPFKPRRVEPHEGYFAYHVGENLDEALGTPLSEEQVTELLGVAASPKPERKEEGRP